MKKIALLTSLFLIFWTISSLTVKKEIGKYNLTIQVEDLRNSIGNVQFTIYNKDGTIPDENFENFYKQGRTKIINNKSSFTFVDLPLGKYAVNILHDEDENKKIKKGWILPVEGIGFSNFESIGFSNRPNFKKASFNVTSNMKKKITIIYM